MQTPTSRSFLVPLLALSCALALTACNPEEVKQPVEQLGQAALEVKEDLKANAEQIKETAAQVQETTEQVQATATKAIDAAQTAAVAAGTQLKEGLEAVGTFMGAEAPKEQP